MQLKQLATRCKPLLRIAVFFAAFALLFSGLSQFFQPVWLDWNNFNTMYGFYEEPRNSIETVFIGSSVVVSGVDPMQLYEDYGIAAYNLGTEQQPMEGTYTLLEEAYRLHKESLKTVFVDVSALRTGTTDAFYRKILDAMPISAVKLRAVMEYVDNDLMDALNYLSPFMAYHTRWSELTEEDYEKASYEAVNGTRGYWLTTDTVSDMAGIETAEQMNTKLNENAKTYVFKEEALDFLDRMVTFCKDRGLKLVLFRTPSENWGSSHHVSLNQLISDKGYDVEFLDFNFSPLADEISYYHPLDNSDTLHLNVYGAEKLTDWFGRYLTEKCGATDVRGNAKYAHMEDQLALYRVNAEPKAIIETTTDAAEYLRAAMRGGYSALVAVRGDASLSLTEEQRALLRETGLVQLADIAENDAYIALIENGAVVTELLKRAATAENSDPLALEGTLANGKSFSVISGGANCGDTASIKINKKEQASNTPGLNIALYDVKAGKLYDTTAFDTSSGIARDVYTADSIRLVTEAEFGAFPEGSFNARLQQVVKPMPEEDVIGEADLFKLLNRYWDDENKVILIAAQNEASGCLKTDHRRLLKEYGLETLASIKARDAYIGIVDGGAVVLEKLDNESQYIEHTEGDYSFISAGYHSGNTSSIVIGGKEYSPRKRGLNIVVYDKESSRVVWAGRFDTNSVKPLLPD